MLRRKAGLTQQQAADAADIGSNHVSTGVELGERGVSYRTLLALVRAYGSNLSELAAEIERGEDD